MIVSTGRRTAERWLGSLRFWWTVWGLVLAQSRVIGVEKANVGFVMPGVVFGDAGRTGDFVGDLGSGIRFAGASAGYDYGAKLRIAPAGLSPASTAASGLIPTFGTLDFLPR